MPLHHWLAIDPASILKEMEEVFRDAVYKQLSRKGVVVAVSGGIDSSVCAALAVRAFGRERVFALLLPEHDSSPSSFTLGENLCRQLDIPYEVKDISSTLEAIGCYAWRDKAILTVFPDYGNDWKIKIVISQDLLDSDRLNFFKLVVKRPDGEVMEKRLPLKAYLQIVAATNFKQRIRKTLEYFHADRLNFAVAGTPNRLEYDQGFFVKNGDGSADVKPIAHLFKSQVYELGRFLGLPEEILATRPSTDTYSFAQSQEEFYFVLPYETMDLVMWGFNAGKSSEEVGRETRLTPEQVLRVFRDIQTKRKTTAPLHMKPILLAPIPEVAM
ncbi:MAG: NAD(+) synthase [candidate division Zixibacteria bacterium RBG_16_53_22]|nr:MAG: NAD(+) synthase [candidate division Zixibacteria bacterium RBG_16_53_22]